ncbi:PH protein [Parelaphostrongylus tenuis]|uniref:PH protein n=1 Tax=Parelaphostrongylus tenuis TaxID=148309 RepID=A0AAD5R8R1_PARTN|nr:PH protein [Parelaphostrongylus tenuis]
MASVDGNTDRIMERVRQRNLELRATLDKDKENIDTSALLEQKSSDKPSKLATDVIANPDICTNSPTNSKTNSGGRAVEAAPATDERAARVRSRFVELAAEYEQFEIDQNWQQAGSKPKEAYMKGVSPRLSIGETRPSVLCTPTGMAQQKLSNNGKSPVHREMSPLKEVINEALPKLETVKEEARRIHFASPIADTQMLDYESSMCTTMNTVDESTIIAGCGVHNTLHALPVPAARKSQKNMYGEVDLSGDEYGAHTFTKKKSKEEGPIKGSDGQVNMSSDEYGPHTFLKKKASTPEKNSPTSPVTIISPKPFVRSASQTHFSPVQFSPVKTSSPNCETRTITMHSKLMAEIPLLEADLPEEANHKTLIDERENRSKITSASHSLKSPSRKCVAEEAKDVTKADLSPIRSAVMGSAKAKKIAEQLEERLKTNQSKIPTPKPLIAAPPTTSFTPVTPTTGVQTQWRGTSNAPVVVGATPGIPIQPDVRVVNLKNLRARWEISSLTGTPIHPDETEDDILKAAIRMRDLSLPPRKVSDKPKDPQPYLAKKVTQSVRDLERSPNRTSVSKDLRYVDESDTEADERPINYQKMSLSKDPYSPYKSPAVEVSPQKSPRTAVESSVRIECSGTNEESIVFDHDKRSADEVNISHNVSDLINRAFEFMETTPNKSATCDATALGSSGGLASKAEEEHFSLIDQLSNSMPLPPVTNHKVIRPSERHTSSDSSDSTSCNGGSLLPYTVSFYRKRLRELRAADSGVEKIDLTTELAATPVQTVIGAGTYRNLEEGQAMREERRGEMEREVSVQQQRIAQATHALRYCKEQTEFRGSREEVDAQRALLIATETRRALLFEIDRLCRGESQGATGPRGTLTISNITVFLDRDYVNSQINYVSNRDEIYYFIVLLRHGCDVQHTALVTSDEGVRKKGLLEFDYYLSLKDLPPDFICVLEVFALRTKREHISHEVKYHLTGTMNKKQRSKFSTVSKTSIGGPSAVIDPAFRLVGRLAIDINTQGRKLQLQDALPPLEGTIIVKMKKQATDKSRTINRGFLSMYQRTSDGLGTWTRYWCVLENGEMRFWRGPDEERDGKQWLVLLDLQTCAGDGASTVRDVCPYPNSFHIDVWVPREGSAGEGSGKPEIEKLRVMLAADTKPHMDSWMEVINLTTRQILMWNRPVSIST